MSIQAEQQRNVRRHWARPGGSHDKLVRLLKNYLPVAVGVLTALLAMAPFTGGDKVSFVLDKNNVEVAKERMRVSEALYRGQDSKGQPFSLRAGSAVQKSSREPIVDLNGAGIGHDVSGDEAQRRGLAAPGRAQERDELVVRDRKVEIADRGEFLLAAAERF